MFDLLYTSTLHNQLPAMPQPLGSCLHVKFFTLLKPFISLYNPNFKKFEYDGVHKNYSTQIAHSLYFFVSMHLFIYFSYDKHKSDRLLNILYARKDPATVNDAA